MWFAGKNLIYFVVGIFFYNAKKCHYVESAKAICYFRSIEFYGFVVSKYGIGKIRYLSSIAGADPFVVFEKLRHNDIKWREGLKKNIE
jgi:hypothetical protein